MAGNVSGWTEGILLTLAFVAVFGLIITSMNIQYGKSYNPNFNDDSDAEQLFITYQDTAREQIEGGEVAFDATRGITLKSSYGIMKDAINVVWGFLSGGFIERLAIAWNFGAAGLIIARALRIIWFLGIVFALLYALFKIKV